MAGLDTDAVVFMKGASEADGVGTTPVDAEPLAVEMLDACDEVLVTFWNGAPLDSGTGITPVDAA